MRLTRHTIGVALVLLFFAAGVAAVVFAASLDSQTVLLLHADGVDASPAFVDSSYSSKTLTRNGDAQVDTGESKFGGASALFDGTGDYISTPDSTDFTLGSSAFTVDFWFNRNGGNGTVRYIAGQSNSSGQNTSINYLLSMNASNVIVFMTCVSSTCTSVTGTTAFTTTGWHHVAAVRTGNTLRLFIDGTQEGGDVTQSGTLNDSSNALAIGRAGELAGNEWNGWIDEFRFSKGIARWTANFTPPTQPYEGGITFTGNVFFASTLSITGNLVKGSGTFLIDHPLDPRNKLLYHSFVESPEVKNMYDGVAELDENGSAVIMLPTYFEALNKDFRYQYTALGEPMPGLYIAEQINNNQFTIGGGAPHGRVSWQVTGNRHDPYIIANPIINEIPKTSETVVGPGECLFEPLCD